MVCKSIQPSLPPPLSLQPVSPSTDIISVDGCGSTSILHPDILQTHILPRLDGPTLSATGCTSSELHVLAADEKLWQKICASTWPSTADPRVSHVISTFRSSFRSFFSDSYPIIHYTHHSNLDRPIPAISGLISAVDIYYKNVSILSKVVEIETETQWFHYSPFRVDLLEYKDFVYPWIQHAGEEDTWLRELEENVTLSWILIDPEKKRAINLSSQRPVLAERHWLTGDVQLKFSVVMAGEDRGGRWWGTEKEYVECGMVVTCGGKEAEEVHVREVCMGMEDLEGRGLCGKDSLVILQGAMERGERRKRGNWNEGKERVEQFLERKKQWKMRKQRNDRVLDILWILFGIAMFVAFCLWLFG